MTHAQALVIGGGLVGLATAYALTRRGVSVCVVEKEDDWAQHQSGHNSGVVHSGVYYPPSSLKLQLATTGGQLLEQFCREHGVTFERTGKAIVATRQDELPRLAALERRAIANGVPVRRLSAAEFAAKEPHVHSVGTLWVESTGIVDFPGVARALVSELEKAGADLLLGTRALSIYDRGGRAHALVQSDRCRALVAQHAVVCAGLQADRLYVGGNGSAPVRISPFRGEYSLLAPNAAHLVKGLVYPVPDPSLPFLGVHLTRGIDGQVHVGPNAVPAFSREGYRRRDISLSDLRESLSYPGTWRLAGRHLGYGVGEVTRSLVRPAYLRSVRRLLPELAAADLVPGPSGVRAQAIRPDGTLVEDFELRRDGSVLHVLNAPSPAATACLAIGEHIASQL